MVIAKVVTPGPSAGPDKSESRYATPGTLVTGGGAAPVMNRTAEGAAPERQFRTSAERQSTGGSDPTLSGNTGTDPFGIEIGGRVWITRPPDS